MGVPQTTKIGPRTYKPAEIIASAKVVEGRDNNGVGDVGVAGVGSNRVLGISINDSAPESTIATTPTMVGGRPVLNMVVPETVTCLADSGIEVPGVTYAAAAKFGDPLIAAAAGAVTPAGATPDARQIVGRCAQPGGVAAGAKGLVRTN